MYASSTPAARGIGISSFESRPKHPTAFTGLPERNHGPSQADDVRLSARASSTVWTQPIDFSAFDLSDDRGLLTAARTTHLFLADHPRVAESVFGKSASLLIRAALELERRGGLDHLPDDSTAGIGRAIENARTFLAAHPRVAESPIGVSIAEMARAIATAIAPDRGGNQTQLTDWLLEAAKRAEFYLEEYPALAGMPLGDVVGRLIDGIKALADGNPLDANLQTLAKRVGYYLQSHPRLAQSEFGQLVAPLGRGLVEIDVPADFGEAPPDEGTAGPTAFLDLREAA